MLARIISGGQTGADRGALDAAQALGLDQGGWAPNGYRSEDGNIPERYRKNMRCTNSRHYHERTKLNVVDSDGTVIVSFARRLTGGSLLTWNLCEAHDRPRLHLVLIETVDQLRDRLITWLSNYKIQTLNVAGPRQSKEPGIQVAARYALVTVLAPYLAGGRT